MIRYNYNIRKNTIQFIYRGLITTDQFVLINCIDVVKKKWTSTGTGPAVTPGAKTHGVGWLKRRQVIGVHLPAILVVAGRWPQHACHPVASHRFPATSETTSPSISAARTSAAFQIVSATPSSDHIPPTATVWNERRPSLSWKQTSCYYYMFFLHAMYERSLLCVGGCPSWWNDGRKEGI